MSADASGLYLFCATPDGGLAPGPALAAYGAEPVEALPLPPLLLWIQHLRHAPERSAESVMVHHRVVEEAWRRADAVAPVRFGQWFRDRTSLEAALRPRVETLAADLERVRGAGEHAVRLDDGSDEVAAAPPADEPAEDATGRGRAHMEALAARERRRRGREARARAVAAELFARVGGLARDQRVEPLRERGLVSVAHLVARDDEEAYGAAVATFVGERPELRAFRGGPWPPWSFVS